MLVALAVLLCCPTAVFAGAITLGSAQSFAVLGASTVTNTGNSVISGDLGLYAGTSITGFFPPGIVINGIIHDTDGVAQQAQIDETTAYNALALLPSTNNETGLILGTGGTVNTLDPGVYNFGTPASPTSAQVTGTLTLDFENMSNALFVFQIGTTLTTASDAAIDVINGNSTDAIYWVVGSSATLGTGTAFAGNILALDSITMNTGSSIVCGRAFAQTAAVTLDDNFISDNCGVSNTTTGPSYYSGTGPTDFGSYGFSGGPAVGPNGSVPEPGSAGLAALGCLFGLLCMRRYRFVRPTR